MVLCFRNLCIKIAFYCFAALNSAKLYGQIELTLDTYLSLALEEKSNIRKMIELQSAINQLDYSISYNSFLPSVSMSINGPTYSKTISPITQPDGSICYRRVNNMDESLLINVSSMNSEQAQLPTRLRVTDRL